jgi:hypothetical protein
MLTSARASCLICGSRSVQPFLNLSETGTPHGAAAHQFTHAYQLIVVCGACGHGQLESYSHDCFHYDGDEDWDMIWWYALDPLALRRLRNLLAECPDQRNAECSCAVHRSLRASGERLWGGVKHAIGPEEKIGFAWIVVDEQSAGVTLEVDQQKGIDQAV